MSDRLTDRLVSPPARASARKRANTDDETRRETTAARDRRTAEVRAYHLRRIVSQFKTTISPENARHLLRLLNMNDPDPP